MAPPPRQTVDVDRDRTVLGIDIGGSGIKGAPVDVDRGELTEERLRIDTPPGAEPDAVAEVVGRIVRHFDHVGGVVGCTFPAVVLGGVVRTAANVSEAWIGTDASALLTAATGRQVVVLNDADAAGQAEVRYGVGRDHERGVLLMLTLGTGIGSALFVDRRLVPNTELGHVELGEVTVEQHAAASVRKNEDLSWPDWARRLSEAITAIDALVWPDLVVLGGGVSRRSEKFVPLLDVRPPVATAVLRNQAGIVGAALTAYERARG